MQLWISATFRNAQGLNWTIRKRKRSSSKSFRAVTSSPLKVIIRCSLCESQLIEFFFPAMVCNVRYSSEVGFCATIFHWSHGDKHTHFMEQVIWDRQTCLRAAMNGLITFKGKSFRVNLNSKEYFYYFKRGSISNAGSCTTDDFEVDGEEFKGAHQKIFLDVSCRLVFTHSLSYHVFFIFRLN